MTFFQNPFTQDFEGNLLLADRQHIPKFVVKGNTGRGVDHVISYGVAPFDLSGNDADGGAHVALRINFTVDGSNWVAIEIPMIAVDLSAVTVYEVVSTLNADTRFASYFVASTTPSGNVKITQKKSPDRFRFYISNQFAEEVLLFNKKAGINEVPSYFNRHTVDNTSNFTDGAGLLIELNVAGSVVDANVVDNAVDVRNNSLGFDSSSPKNDWEMLEGKSGLFMFQKQTVDGSGRVTETIEYHAGAKVGDLAKKTKYTYTGAFTNPDQMTQEPYVLTSGDLVTP